MDVAECSIEAKKRKRNLNASDVNLADFDARLCSVEVGKT